MRELETRSRAAHFCLVSLLQNLKEECGGIAEEAGWPEERSLWVENRTFRVDREELEGRGKTNRIRSDRPYGADPGWGRDARSFDGTGAGSERQAHALIDGEGGNAEHQVGYVR